MKRASSPSRSSSGQAGSVLAARFSSLQAQVVREQLLERQPALRRMAAGRELGELGLARRPVHVGRALPAATASRAAAMTCAGIQSRTAARLELLQRLRDQRAQPALRHPFGQRIDRRQRLLERRRSVVRAPAGIPGARSPARAVRAGPRRSSGCACRAPARSAARPRNRRTAASESRSRRRCGTAAAAAAGRRPP